MTTRQLIVAGVDGSEGGRRALPRAAREAATRGSAVLAVTAWSSDGLEFGPVTATSPADARERASRLLDDEVRALIARHGSHRPVASEVVEGRPAEDLTNAAGPADLLVLGSHGHSRVRHTVLGSVSQACIRQAACPVVVIPVPAPQPAAYGVHTGP